MLFNVANDVAYSNKYVCACTFKMQHSPSTHHWNITELIFSSDLMFWNENGFSLSSHSPFDPLPVGVWWQRTGKPQLCVASLAQSISSIPVRNGHAPRTLGEQPASPHAPLCQARCSPGRALCTHWTFLRWFSQGPLQCLGSGNIPDLVLPPGRTQLQGLNLEIRAGFTCATGLYLGWEFAWFWFSRLFIQSKVCHLYLVANGELNSLNLSGRALHASTVKTAFSDESVTYFLSYIYFF